MDRRTTKIVGICLLSLGILLLLSEYGFLYRIHLKWPSILLIVGAALLIAYFTSKPRLVYLEGGCLLVWLGLLFSFVERGWQGHHYGLYWPGIIIAVGLSEITVGSISPARRKRIFSGLMLIVIGGVLQFFTLRGWHRFGYESLIAICGLVMILFGIKLFGEAFFRKEERV
jgi:hypothetical protein